MKTVLTGLVVLCASSVMAQYDYAPSAEYPFGRPHPDAPQQVKDYEPMIGICDCKSESRNPDQTWADPVDMVWTFKYIQNGRAVQDETLKADGRHSGSIRQYSIDSARWYVHFYSFPAISTTLSTWEGNKKDGNIVLYRKQPAPNGTDGFYRLTFSELSQVGFKWAGEWVDTSETVVFPTWRITCKKRGS